MEGELVLSNLNLEIRDAGLCKYRFKVNYG